MPNSQLIKPAAIHGPSGRPRLYNGRMVPVGISLPKSTLDALRIQAKEQDKTLGYLMRKYIMNALEVGDEESP